MRLPISPSSLAGCALSLVLTGCSPVVDLPPPPAGRPLVEFLLVAGSTPTARIRIIEPEGVERPIDPALVRLDLVAENGARSPLSSLTAAEGTFRASMTIEPGRIYRLEGTISGAPIRSQTRVPDRLEVVEPSGTVRAEERIPYRFRATGATAFSMDHGRFENSFSQSQDTTGILFVAEFSTPTKPPELTIFAMNRDAEGYLFNVAAPENNIDGALGLFGAALAIRRPIQWP